MSTANTSDLEGSENESNEELRFCFCLDITCVLSTGSRVFYLNFC